MGLDSFGNKLFIAVSAAALISAAGCKKDAPKEEDSGMQSTIKERGPDDPRDIGRCLFGVALDLPASTPREERILRVLYSPSLKSERDKCGFSDLTREVRESMERVLVDGRDDIEKRKSEDSEPSDIEQMVDRAVEDVERDTRDESVRRYEEASQSPGARPVPRAEAAGPGKGRARGLELVSPLSDQIRRQRESERAPSSTTPGPKPAEKKVRRGKGPL